MLFRHVPAAALIFCLPASPAIAQSSETLDEDCVVACLFKQKELPPQCNCKAVSLATGNTSGPVDSPFPNSPSAARDLIYKAKAQYDARMADIEDYYFVEQSIVDLPAGNIMPGIQIPLGPNQPTTGLAGTGMPVGMPIVRFFTGELDADGEKRFKEVSPADLARMQQENASDDPLDQMSPQQKSDLEALSQDPAAIYGAFADAYKIIAGNVPDNAAGGLVGGLAGIVAGGLKEVEAGVAGQQNSADGFGGDGASDGLGMALEKELLDNFNAGADGLGVPTYAAHYWPTNRQYLWSVLPVIAGTQTWDAHACISQSCGATQESFESVVDFMAFAATKMDEGEMLGYVVRIDTRDNPRDIFWEGRTFRLALAELWLMSVNGQLALLGGDEELVVARMRFEYTEYDSDLDVATEKVVIDTYSEGFEPKNPILAPKKITQTMQTGGTEMKVNRFLSLLTTNAGPPSQEEIVALIADTMATSLDDPTSSIPSAPAAAPAPQPAPSSNPATGQTPLLNPGQGTPIVRDDIPIIPRPNN